MIRNVQSNPLYLHTYDTIFQTICHVLSPDLDFLVTTSILNVLGNSNIEFLMSSGSALNATGTVCKMKNISS